MMNNITLTNDIATANLITHGGIFHADEIFATVILAKANPDKELRLCRTFNVDNAQAGAIVYDIGGGRFDHHQRGGNGCRENGVPFAAAGLIWQEYGMAALEKSGGTSHANWRCKKRHGYRTF